MKVAEAYQIAYSEITEKGYNTYAYERFSEGDYHGIVVLSKRATKKSKVSVVYKVYSKHSKYLLTKEKKQRFMQLYGNQKVVS